MKKLIVVLLVLCSLVLSLAACDKKDKTTETQKEAQGLTYIQNTDGTYSVSGIGTCTNTDITIPATYNGVAVTSIEDYAFHSCKNLIKVALPDSVTSIGDYAFSGCTLLKEITIPDSVTSVGDYAFSGCISLNYTEYNNTKYLGNNTNPYVVLIDVSDDVESFTILEGTKIICDAAFKYCYSLTNVTIGNGVTSIGDYAFEGCTSLTSIKIPDSVKSIGDYAFEGCTSLTSVTIPDSVQSIGDYAFSGCTNLTYTEYNNAKYLGNKTNPYVVLIDVNDDVKNFTILEGTRIIYDFAFSSCKNLTSIKIPDSVKSIGRGLFSNCTDLKSVTIPNGVTSIGVNTFNSCTSLTSVTIPDSVTSIGNQAFYECSSLKNVYYTGTEAEWGAITIGSYNSPLTSATIHYNYGTVSIPTAW